MGLKPMRILLKPRMNTDEHGLGTTEDTEDAEAGPKADE
jgi:hypothetical protein